MSTAYRPLASIGGRARARVRSARRTALQIAWLASAISVVPTATAVAQIDAQIDAPIVSDIRARHDTVSFYVRESEYAAYEWRVAGFALASRAWVGGDSAVRPVALTTPQHAGDVVRLAPDLALTAVRRQPLRGEFFDYFVVAGQPVHRYSLHATLSPAERWRLLLSRDSTAILWRDEPPPLCSSPGPWTLDAGSIWFGCTEGGGLSGVLRFNRTTHRTTMETAPGVASTRIIGVARTPRAIWVAGRVDRASDHTDSGLFRFDVARGTWTRLDRVPTALAAGHDKLWIATRDGIAAYDERADRWTDWWFHATMALDTIDDAHGISMPRAREQFALVATRPSSDELRQRLRIALAVRLVNDPRMGGPAGGVTTDSILAIIRAMPDVHLDSALDDPEDPLEYALAYPPIIAVATSRWYNADSTLDSWDLDITGAAATLHDRRYAPLLRRVRDASATSEQLWLSQALAQIGDTSGSRWLYDAVGDDQDWSQLIPAARVLAALDDTTAAPLIVARFTKLDPKDAFAPGLLVEALATVATAAQWHRAIADLGDAPVFRQALLESSDSHPLDSLIQSDTSTRRLTLAIAREKLAKPGDTTPWQAARLTATIGDASAIPSLIALLTRSAADSRIAAATLVQLTGIDSAPPAATTDSLDMRRSRRFWDEWWNAHRDGFEPVSTQAGQSAFLHWRLRTLGLDHATS